MNKRFVITVLSVILSSGFVYADPGSKKQMRNEKRERHQHQRMAEGMKSGELTREEARRLKKGQKHIDKAQEKFAADGELSREEKLKLEKMQDHQSRKIYRLNNNEKQADSKE